MVRAPRGAGSATVGITHLRSQKRPYALSNTLHESESAAPTSFRAKTPTHRSQSNVIGSTKKKKEDVVLGPLRPRSISSEPTSSHNPDIFACSDQLDARILWRYPNLIPARLLRRYKRFLADVVLLHDTVNNQSTAVTTCGRKVAGSSIGEKEGTVDEVVTVYCPNTGPMVGLLDGAPNARVQLSKSSDPKRKYAYTLEMIQIHNGDRHVWVGVHSSSANRMVEQALTSRWLPELGQYDSVRREVKFAEGSRVDFVLVTTAEDGSVAHEKYVEVKSVTLSVERGGGSGQHTSRCAVFPDTVSTRAQKHVVELTAMLSTKDKARVNQKSETVAPERSGAIIFLIQRDDCHAFAPSIQHDKKFADLCLIAANSGIQLLAYACALEPEESNGSGTVRLLTALPLHKGTIVDEIPS